MKKPKVLLITSSPKFKDGSRKTIRLQTICTCNERGAAELICDLLRDSTYRSLLEDYADNTQMFQLVVGY